MINKMNPDIIGNITTIIKIVIMTIAPAIAVYIGTDEQTIITFLTACLTFALAIIDAKYPNNFGDKPVAAESEVLNDEYVTGDEDDI
jgi:uncharacterized membrane protein YqaE (UPF0057 family)